MKYIKFNMSKGNSVTLPENKAEAVLESKEQVIQIYDESGNWTGKTINKAFIISTEIDVETTNEEMKSKKLDDNMKYIEIESSRVNKIISTADLFKKYRPQFMEGKTSRNF